MMGGGCLNLNAVMILLAVLLGCLAISAQCARELDLGGKMQIELTGDEYGRRETDRVGEICKRSACSYLTTCYCCLISEQICYKTVGLCQKGCLAQPPPPPTRNPRLLQALVIAGTNHGSRHMLLGRP
ncbi:hypothetical protein ACP70R_033628 [Stipagrostis hirtigluma subsp. patula]